MNTRAALLLVLRDGPGYGTDLIRRAGERSAGSIRLSAARVYPSLTALQRAKLVRASTVVPGGRRGARSRTYYDLTIAGVAASNRLRGILAALAAGRPPAPLDAATRARMARRLLEADALSTAAAAMAFKRAKTVR